MINTILLVLILILTRFVAYRINEWENIRKDLQKKLDDKQKQEESDFIKNYYINKYIEDVENWKQGVLLAIWQDEADAILKERKELKKKETEKKMRTENGDEKWE